MTMKQSIVFFSAITFSLLLFFSSCTKEEVQTPTVSEAVTPMEIGKDKASSRSAVGIHMGPVTLARVIGHAECVMDYGFCLDLEPIYAPDTELAENQAMYIAYANEEGGLVLRLDGSQHSESFIQSVIDDPYFRLTYDVTIAEEIVVGAYESSGQTPPSDPVVLPAGEYDVVFDGEQFTTSVNTPIGVLVIIDDVH